MKLKLLQLGLEQAILEAIKHAENSDAQIISIGMSKLQQGILVEKLRQDLNNKAGELVNGYKLKRLFGIKIVRTKDLCITTKIPLLMRI